MLYVPGGRDDQIGRMVRVSVIFFSDLAAKAPDRFGVPAIESPNGWPGK